MTIDFDALVNAPCVATFGEAVTYQPRVGASFSISGVFDAAWQDVTFNVNRYGSPVSTTKPCFGVRQSDFPTGVSPAQGDSFTRTGGDKYTVADTRPDGLSGYIYLILN